MACQILYCFGVNRSVNEVGDICVPQLMWRYLKIKAIYDLTIVPSFFTQNRCYSFCDFLAV